MAVQEGIALLAEEVENLRAEVEQAHHFEAFLAAEGDQHPVLPVLNRRAFLRELTRVLEASEREDLPGSVALLHLAGTERLRLQHGIAARDAALSHAVDIIKGELRQTDLLAYVDGGDFAIALVVAEDDGAVQKMRDIADRLAHEPFIWQEQTVCFAARIGLVHFRPGLAAAAALLEADTQASTLTQ